MAKITKILVANRGEIALRIMRSVQEMGIQTVAIYSHADRQSPHVRFADEAYFAGPSPSSESYLRMDNIIEIATQSGAQAIHPGYGFLSENEHFATKVEQCGLVFIGPSASSIALMANKLSAKKAVSRYSVPLVPGTSEPVQDLAQAKRIAREIGYPVLIKASAGGGGKGMRIVDNEEEFDGQMERAVSEATSSFGDGSVFIEKYVSRPRHIEFQILGDKYGNIVHLFERECSIQRRHQKIIEEAPSSILTPKIRQAMGDAAVKVARACNYYGAGTVEFILDEKLNFYFLEMNTRLQVEHPVTEAITGLDLVKLQIQIAGGEKLPFDQKDIIPRGHAIEVRVYAEDPSTGFLPDIGTLTRYRRPQGHGVRVDDGLDEGMEVPFYYDPMIAKLICYGEDRKSAIRKMIRAISEYEIAGLETTLGFCKFVMEHEAFNSGDFDTHFVEKHFRPEFLIPTGNQTESMLASALAMIAMTSIPAETQSASRGQTSKKWKKNRSPNG
jgi:acetyl-CoA carboxylase, biotin carboxylase subunit